MQRCDPCVGAVFPCSCRYNGSGRPNRFDVLNIARRTPLRSGVVLFNVLQEAELTNQLKEALTATAQKLKQQAAQLEQEVLLPSTLPLNLRLCCRIVAR